MSSLEDEIRDALRSEAGRLREVRPLHLEPARYRRAASARPRRARLRWTWLAPVTAATMVIALAIALVIVRTEQNGPAVPPVAPQPAAPTTFPRYYAALGAQNEDGNATSLIVGDTHVKAPLATIAAPAGASFETTTLAAAADDRTFVVAKTLGQRKPPFPPYPTDGPTAWYQIRLSPGSANQVTMTRLPISDRDADLPVRDTALSGDGRYLAVALGDAGTVRQEVQIYSVISGQLLHDWTMAVGTFSTYVAINALTWVNGDGTIEFGWGENRNNTQVRTLSVSAPGTSLLTASHAAWSHYFPPPGNVPTSMECGSLTITTDGRTAMECVRYISKTGVVSPVEWLAYPISASASPSAKPRVVAAIPAPPATLKDEISTGINVVYVSAREVIGYSAPYASPKVHTVTIHEFLASGDTVRQLGTGTIPSIWTGAGMVW